MGRKNHELVRACEAARRTHDFLVEMVEASQEACPHPENVRVRGKFFVWCHDCSKRLGSITEGDAK